MLGIALGIADNAEYQTIPPITDYNLNLQDETTSLDDEADTQLTMEAA